MSVYATMFVWETSKQKSTALLALLALADYANEETGEAYPGMAKLAKKLRMKERNVQTLLRKLEDDGEIKISENKGVQTATGRTNRYGLTGYIEWYQEVQKIASLKKQGVQDSVTRGARFRKQGVQEVAPNPVLEPLENIPVAQKSADKPKRQRKPKPYDDVDSKEIAARIDGWLKALPAKPIGNHFNNDTMRTVAAEMVRRNISAECVTEYVTFLLRDKFWKDKTPDFSYVAKNIPAWINKRNPVISRIIQLDIEPADYPNTADYVNLAGGA